MASRNKPENAPVQSRIPRGALLIGAILLVALLLRLVRLGHTLLWIDELDVFWNSSLQRGPLEVVRYTLRHCFEINTNEQMPFQYAWLNLFLRLYRALGVDPGPALIRLPFALLGFLSLCALYPAVRRLYNRETAWWTLGLATISFFHVYQSRDATSYNPLMFFLALHLYGLGGWLRPDGVRIRDRLAFIVGAVGMLMSHLSSWLFLGPEGLVLVGRAILIRWRKAGKAAGRGEFIGGSLEPAAWLILCALPFLIVIYRAVTIFKPPGLKEEVEISTLSLSFFRYQVAHFGWGMGGGRLAAFGLVLLGGVAGLFQDRPLRGRGLAHLFLLVVPVFLLFVAPHALIYPRYLTIGFLPLLVLAAGGMTWWMQQLRRVLRLTLRREWAPAAAAVAILVWWHIRPMAELFALRSKLMPVPQLIEWLETRVPENGLYVWESGYNLRDVPGAYPVRGRQAAFATMHSGSIRVSPVAEQLGPLARSIFQRFPLAVLLATGFPEPPATGPWAWIGTDFARREIIRNEGLEDLHLYGFSPHGVQYPANLNIVCYFNRPEDLPGRFGVDGFLAYPDGPGWQYLQTREGALFASPNPSAALRVRNLSGETQTAQVVFEGAVQAVGSLRVTGPGGTVLTKTLQPANQIRQAVGPFSFPPGDQDVRVEFWPAGRNALLVYAFHVAPLPAGPPPVEAPR